jgi:1,4-alpha-glucan branching enzyme
MHRLDPIGVFEIFVPGALENDGYQFEIKTRSGLILKRPDPYAIKSRGENGIISVITPLKSIKWTDDKWMKERTKFNVSESPLSIAEICLESFAGRHEGKSTMEEITADVLEFVKNHGFNAIELMPIMKHVPGHFYHILNFFSLDDTYGDTCDFMKFVDIILQKLKCLIMLSLYKVNSHLVDLCLSLR